MVPVMECTEVIVRCEMKEWHVFLSASLLFLRSTVRASSVLSRAAFQRIVHVISARLCGRALAKDDDFYLPRSKNLINVVYSPSTDNRP